MTLKLNLHFRHFLALLPLAALLAFMPVPGHAQDVPVLVMSDGDGFWEAKDAADALFDGTQTYLGQAVADGLTINVYSKDAAGAGFRLGTERLARILGALTHVADVLNQPGELDLMLGASQFDGTGALATGGPLFAALPVQNGTAFARLQTGVKPFANYAEMVLTFDWGWNWNTGLGNPASDQVDLRSVAIHELTHTLGFLSLIQVTGASSIGGGYSVFDTLIAKGDGTLLLSGSPPAFTATVNDLRSGTLIFKGETARATYGMVYPPIYSPATFASGSSVQHWAEGISGGAVMEPRYLTGVIKRAYAAVDIAALRDLGYTNADTAESYQPCPLSAVAIVSPAGDIDAVADTVAVSLRSSVAFNTGTDCIAATASTVTVEYFINNVSKGTSQDAAGGFPVNVVLAPGDYTLRVEAERNDLAGMVQAERAFTVNEPQPILSVNPTSGPLNFGTVYFGETADRVFTVSNTGIGTLNGLASLTGNDEFTFLGSNNYTLTSGESRIITVRFTPPDTPGTFSATLTFTGQGGPVQITLTATGAVPQPVLEINPSGPVTFGTVYFGETADRAFTVRNTGTGILNGLASLTGDGEFTFLGTNNYAVPSGESRIITVRFTPPDTPGTFSATLTFTGQGGPVQVTLTGTGEAPQPVLAINPASGPVDFGTLGFGASLDRVFTVTNAGTGTLNGVASLAGDGEFTFVGDDSYALANGASQNIIVRFTPPKKGGNFTATLTFTGDGGPVQIALTGTGTRTGFLNCAGGGNGVSWNRSVLSDALLLAALMGLLAWQSRRNAAIRRRG